MKRLNHRWLRLAALLLAGALLLTGCAVDTGTTDTKATAAPIATSTPQAQATATPGDKEAVAEHIAEFGQLPDYYITKQQARDLGWTGGSVERYAPGKLIGGDRFGNYEGLLPTARGRTYTECDINTWGMPSRGGERIVFSNDGLIYYTDDHYESFRLLRGTE